jgi:hypothetical protein
MTEEKAREILSARTYCEEEKTYYSHYVSKGRRMNDGNISFICFGCPENKEPDFPINAFESWVEDGLKREEYPQDDAEPVIGGVGRFWVDDTTAICGYSTPIRIRTRREAREYGFDLSKLAATA